jgi:acetyl-CoA synthetase
LPAEEPMSELEQFLASRDALLTHRTDYEAAVAAFR